MIENAFAFYEHLKALAIIRLHLWTVTGHNGCLKIPQQLKGLNTPGLNHLNKTWA